MIFFLVIPSTQLLPPKRERLLVVSVRGNNNNANNPLFFRTKENEKEISSSVFLSSVFFSFVRALRDSIQKETLRVSAKVY